MDETHPSASPQRATTDTVPGAPSPSAIEDPSSVTATAPGTAVVPASIARRDAGAADHPLLAMPEDRTVATPGVPAQPVDRSSPVVAPSSTVPEGRAGGGASIGQHAEASGQPPDAAGVGSPAAGSAQATGEAQAARAPHVASPGDFDPSGPSQPAYLHRTDTPWSILGRIFKARTRALFHRAGQRITQRTLHIGVSARIFHPEPDGVGLRGKTLQYLEESIAHWIMSRDVIVFMIPTVAQQGMLHYSNIRLRDYASHLDALVLQGGADVSPQSYSLQATRPEWPGDRVRDMYELELLHAFVEAGKPVLGVCRGCQLINVAFGGTLYQDILSDVPEAHPHVADSYDRHRHAITFPSGSSLAGMFGGVDRAMVNSIHHQAVRTFGPDVSVEARSADDGIVEAIRYRKAPFVVGVQWHPEFHRAGGQELLDCTPLLDHFLRAARETRF